MKPKILMIDDDPFFIQGWKRMLDPKYQVTACYSPEKAMTDYSYDEYQYILVDFHFSGYEETGEVAIAVKIQKHISRLCPWTPVILLTAYADDPESCNVFNRGRWASTIHKKSNKAGAIALLTLILSRFQEAQTQSLIWLDEDYPGEYPIKYLDCKSLEKRLDALEHAFAHAGEKKQLSLKHYYVEQAYRIQFLAGVFLKHTNGKVPDATVFDKIRELNTAHGGKNQPAKKKLISDLSAEYGISISEPSAWSQAFPITSRGKLAIQAFKFRYLVMENLKKKPKKEWLLTCTWYTPANNLIFELGLNLLDDLSHIEKKAADADGTC